MTPWFKSSLVVAAVIAAPAFAQESGTGTTSPDTGTDVTTDVDVNADPMAGEDAALSDTLDADGNGIPDADEAEQRSRAAEQTEASDMGMQADPMLRSDPMIVPPADTDVSVSVDADDDLDASPRFVAIPDMDEQRDLGILTGVGTHVSVGGGVNNFIDDTARAATNPGGEWHARAAVGTRSIIGVEGQYEGGARDIEAAGLDEDAWLVSTALEGALRLNAPISIERGIIEPYALGGIGWQNFNIANNDANTASVDDVDNVFTVPVGVGLMAGYGGFVADARFTYRYAAGSDMFGQSDNGFDDNSLSNWSLGGSLGFEF